VPKNFHVPQPFEELQDDEGPNRRLGPVGRSPEPAPPIRNVAVRVLGFEDGLERVDRQFLAFERELQGVEKRGPPEDRPMVPSAFRARQDQGAASRRVETMAARLVKDRPMKAVGDGFGRSRIKASDLDPFLFVNAGFFVDKNADRILADVRMLEIDISDAAELTGK